MSNVPIIGKQNPNTQNEDGTILDDNRQEFVVENLVGRGSVEILAEKDDKGDYPVVKFFYEKEGHRTTFGIGRDELAAITFALARQDQQSRLLNAKFREYKEVPVRLVVQASKDIKKGDMLIVWRKEKVPIDMNYTYEKFSKPVTTK